MHMFDTAEEARAAGRMYHLTPVEVWDRQRNTARYVPEAFERDGFIHATNGLQPLLEVANTFYKMDQRPFLVLVLDVPVVQSEVRYEDPDNLYPHIYGSLNVDAVVGQLVAVRSSEGGFLAFE